MSKIELQSPFTPEECEARLQAAVETGYFTMFSNKPVVGRVSGLTVQIRKRTGFRNLMQPLLSGRLEDRDGKTIFRSEFAIGQLNRVPMFMWLLFAGGIVVIHLTTKVQQMPGGGGIVLGSLLFPIYLVLGIAVVWTGRWMARGEEEYLTSFVTDVIGSKAQRADLP